MEPIEFSFFDFHSATFEESRNVLGYHDGFYYYPVALIIDGITFVISAGHADDVTVFEDGTNYYVLTENGVLGYCSLEVFRKDDLSSGVYTPVDVFFYNTEEIKRMGSAIPFDELTDLEKVQALEQYLC